MEGSAAVAGRPLCQPLGPEAEAVLAPSCLERDREVAVHALPALVRVAERETGRQVRRVPEVRLDAVQREGRHLGAARSEGGRREQRRAHESSAGEGQRTGGHDSSVPAVRSRSVFSLCGFCEGARRRVAG